VSKCECLCCDFESNVSAREEEPSTIINHPRLDSPMGEEQKGRRDYQKSVMESRNGEKDRENEEKFREMGSE